MMRWKTTTRLTPAPSLSRQPRDRCDREVKQKKYKPPSFEVKALASSKVSLTWDEEDDDRTKSIRSYYREREERATKKRKGKRVPGANEEWEIEDEDLEK